MPARPSSKRPSTLGGRPRAPPEPSIAVNPRPRPRLSNEICRRAARLLLRHSLAAAGSIQPNQERNTMSIFKPYVRSTSFIAKLTAGMVLLAATDGANAKVGSDETRASGPSPTANLIRNTIHPIIYPPGG